MTLPHTHTLLTHTTVHHCDRFQSQKAPSKETGGRQAAEAPLRNHVRFQPRFVPYPASGRSTQRGRGPAGGGGEGGAAGQGAAQGQEGEDTAAECAEWNEWVRATEKRYNALRGQLEEQEARTRDIVEVTEFRGSVRAGIGSGQTSRPANRRSNRSSAGGMRHLGGRAWRKRHGGTGSCAG